MTSIITRQMHKILAGRLRETVVLEKRQRAFIPVDGVAENVTVLDAVIATAKTELRTAHIATLDVAKAFDSVSHYAIIEAAKRLGCPKMFTDYLWNIYSTAHTSLETGWGTEREIMVRRGVRKGTH